MQSRQQWIDENRPDGDLDYQRLADATDLVEAEMRKAGPRQILNGRFDFDVGMRQGMRRAEELAQGTRLENPDESVLLLWLTNTWCEGFIFGALAYAEEGRGRVSQALLDRMAVANINHKLSRADRNTLGEVFSSAVSPAALAFVSAARSMKAHEALGLRDLVADHQQIKAVTSSHWLDGFLMGLIFEELGGHRD